MLLTDALPQFTTDNWLTIIGFTSISAVYFANSRSISKLLGQRLELIDAGMEDFRQDMKRMHDVITAQAVQSERLTQMGQSVILQGKRVDRLETKVFKFVQPDPD